MITLDAGQFEAFPLPDYAAQHVTDEYKSYFVEVEQGIKIHVLEVGSGFPVFLQHGNPTSGFLYRKIAEELPKTNFESSCRRSLAWVFQARFLRVSIRSPTTYAGSMVFCHN